MKLSHESNILKGVIQLCVSLLEPRVQITRLDSYRDVI